MASYKWVGDGLESISGVPARDLTEEESEKYGDLIERVRENTGRELYKLETKSGEADPNSGESPSGEADEEFDIE